MHVFNRVEGQAIRIGPSTTVHVAKIVDKQVHLGVRAPRHVEVHREEIYYRRHPELAPEHASARSDTQAQQAGGDAALGDDVLPASVKEKRRRR